MSPADFFFFDVRGVATGLHLWASEVVEMMGLRGAGEEMVDWQVEQLFNNVGHLRKSSIICSFKNNSYSKLGGIQSPNESDFVHFWLRFFFSHFRRSVFYAVVLAPTSRNYVTV